MKPRPGDTTALLCAFSVDGMGLGWGPLAGSRTSLCRSCASVLQCASVHPMFCCCPERLPTPNLPAAVPVHPILSSPAEDEEQTLSPLRSLFQLSLCYSLLFLSLKAQFSQPTLLFSSPTWQKCPYGFLPPYPSPGYLQGSAEPQASGLAES